MSFGAFGDGPVFASSLQLSKKPHFGCQDLLLGGVRNRAETVLKVVLENGLNVCESHEAWVAYAVSLGVQRYVGGMFRSHGGGDRRNSDHRVVPGFIEGAILKD